MDDLAAATGTRPDALAYPFGLAVAADAAAVLPCVGISSAYITAETPGQQWSDPLAVPRLQIRDWPEPMFREQVERSRSLCPW
jgi:hypothetical protein